MKDPRPSGDSSNRRLDSWKEIAFFFGKDVRTVRRWEKERALPVHRAPGKPGGSVYAFTQELSDWLNSPPPAPEQLAPPEADGFLAPPDDARPWGLGFRSTKTFLAAVVLLVFTAVGLLWIHARMAPRRVPVHGSSNPEAVDLYLKGRYEWSKRSPDSLNRAVDYFTQAIVRDPNYAQAYAGLADTYNLLREYTVMPSGEAYPRAIAAARKAVEFDDSLAEAHRALAFATFYWTWDFVVGEREFRRAIELNPNDAVAHHWYGTALAALARFPEALAELERAQKLDPASASILADKGIILCYMGREEEAIPLLRQVETADPNFLSPHRYLAYIGLLRHDERLYRDESRRAAELAHDSNGLEMVAAAEQGGAAWLDRVRHVQEKQYEQGLVSGVAVADTCALLGKNQEAIRYLEQDFKKHNPTILNVRSDPALRTLRNDPAFRDLLRRIGLPTV